MAHTSLPWMIERATMNGRDYGIERIAPVNPDVDLCVEGSGGARSYTRTIASFVRTADDEDNAALIVRAANSHATMLTALKLARATLSGYANELLHSYCTLDKKGSRDRTTMEPQEAAHVAEIEVVLMAVEAAIGKGAAP